MKTKLIALMLLLGSSAFAAHFSFGIGIGPAWGYYAAPPPPPPVYAYAPPVAPYPGYTWIAGYWYPVGPRWYWRAGYWTRPPFAGAVWIGPRYYGGRYFAGRWRR
jgi:hypothetical protein